MRCVTYAKVRGLGELLTPFAAVRDCLAPEGIHPGNRGISQVHRGKERVRSEAGCDPQHTAHNNCKCDELNARSYFSRSTFRSIGPEIWLGKVFKFLDSKRHSSPLLSPLNTTRMTMVQICFINTTIMPFVVGLKVIVKLRLHTSPFLWGFTVQRKMIDQWNTLLSSLAVLERGL